jgi:hypothetical protein
MTLLLFWFFTPLVDSSVDDNVSKKHTASIFRAKVSMLGSAGFYTESEQMKADGVGQTGTGRGGGGAFPFSKHIFIFSLPSIATSALKMVTVCLTEALVSADEFTQRQNP